MKQQGTWLRNKLPARMATSVAPLPSSWTTMPAEPCHTEACVVPLPSPWNVLPAVCAQHHSTISPSRLAARLVNAPVGSAISMYQVCMFKEQGTWLRNELPSRNATNVEPLQWPLPLALLQQVSFSSRLSRVSLVPAVAYGQIQDCR